MIKFLEALRPSKIKEKWQRKRAYEKIRAVRKGEQSGVFYNRRRDIKGYAHMLAGFNGTLEYAKLLKNKTVLDLGAGTTRAISQIRDSGKYDGLTFSATTLTRDPNIADNLGFENVRITSVEELRGIPDESISCILATYSLPYVASVELAVRNIDRVLEKGGVLKAAMTTYDSGNNWFNAYMGKEKKSVDKFERVFKRMGYEVLVKPGSIPVLIVRKPGGELNVELEDILKKDFEDLQMTVR